MKMSCELINKIGAHYKAFTKTEKKVADYIMENPREVLYLSISDLAERCGVGDTTVFRFCRTLDLGGYQEFKMNLAQSISSEANIIASAKSIRLQDTVPEVCSKLLTMEQEVLQATHQMLKAEDISKAVGMLEKASRICFFGFGASGVTALAAKNRFLRVIPYVFYEQDSHTQSMAAALMKPGELAVFITYSGTTKDMLDVAKSCRRAGASSICITRYTKSPITELADVILLCGANEGPMQGGAMATMISQLYLVDILYTEYYRRNFERCVENRRLAVESISGKLL